MKKIFTGFMVFVLNVFVITGCSTKENSELINDPVGKGSGFDDMVEGYDDVDITAKPLYKELPSIKK
jgi:hypothetical protein